MNKQNFVFISMICLLSACSDRTAQIVDEKLASVENQPTMPIVQPLPQPTELPSEYRAAKDPFASPFARSTAETDASAQSSAAQQKQADDAEKEDAKKEAVKSSAQNSAPSRQSSTQASIAASQDLSDQPPKPVGEKLAILVNRPREPLEQFALSSLRYVGSISSDGVQRALVQSANGVVHQLAVGAYLGQNHGQLIAITPRALLVREAYLYDGEYYRRDSELPLR